MSSIAERGIVSGERTGRLTDTKMTHKEAIREVSHALRATRAVRAHYIWPELDKAIEILDRAEGRLFQIYHGTDEEAKDD